MKNSLYNERKYLLLRKKLDELHYSLPLQIESTELVDKILNDLLKTSDGFQKLKKQNEELQQQIDLNERSLNPLKQETQKILRENTKLHSDIIQAKDNALQRNHVFEVRLKSMENESKDLKFVIEQLENKCRRLQEEWLILRTIVINWIGFIQDLKYILKKNLGIKNKLDTISAKVYLPSCEKGYNDLPKTYINANAKSITNMSLGKESTQIQQVLNKGVDYRNQSVNQDDIDQLMSSGNKGYNQYDNYHNGDMLSKTKSLQEELRHFKEQRYSKESEISYLKVQVQNRDAEIYRLQARLDVGGINMSKLVGDYNIMQQQDKISLLNHKIDYLNKENTSMDNILKTKPYILLSEANVKLQAENSTLLEKLKYYDEKVKDQEKKLEIKYQNGRFQKYSSNASANYEDNN